MPEFLRVTDDVQPRREYTINAESLMHAHKVLKGKRATANDGTPLPPKHTPDGLAADPESPVEPERPEGHNPTKEKDR